MTPVGSHRVFIESARPTFDTVVAEHLRYRIKVLVQRQNREAGYFGERHEPLLKSLWGWADLLRRLLRRQTPVGPRDRLPRAIHGCMNQRSASEPNRKRRPVIVDGITRT